MLEKRLGQGRDKALQYLRENPLLQDEIEKVWLCFYILLCLVFFFFIIREAMLLESMICLLLLIDLLHFHGDVGGWNLTENENSTCYSILDGWKWLLQFADSSVHDGRCYRRRTSRFSEFQELAFRPSGWWYSWRDSMRIINYLSMFPM